MPPDRVFGRIEKDICQQKVISGPENYYSIFRRYGKVKILNINWQIYDFRTLAGTLLKRTSDLKMQTNRLCIFQRNSEIGTS